MAGSSERKQSPEHSHVHSISWTIDDEDSPSPPLLAPKMSQSPTSPVEGFNSPPSSPELNIDEGPCHTEDPASELLSSEKAVSENLPDESVESETDEAASSSVSQLPQVVSCSESGDICIDTPLKSSNSAELVSDEDKQVPCEENFLEEVKDVEELENIEAEPASPDGATNASDSPADDSLNVTTKCTGSEAEITKISSGISQSVDENVSILLENSNASMPECSPTNEDDANDLKTDDFKIDDAMDTSQTSPPCLEKDISLSSETVEKESEAIPPEDLEDGELPDSDDEDDSPKKSEGKETPLSILELEMKLQKSLEKEKSKEKQKEKEKEKKKKEKEKEKEKKKEKDKEKKKRRHSDEENKSASKSKRKKEEEGGDDTEFLYVRGASPTKPGFDNGEEYVSRGDYDEVDEFDRRGDRDHRGRRREERGVAPGNRGRAVDNSSRKNDTKPPKTDMICLYFMQGKCQKSADDCNFSHDAVPPRKFELCKFWMMDCCAKKEKCLYLHNDFPCKFYHTGLICKLGDKCKFSHNPLNEQTKNVLLKHIETAPKEILGDFPRLNRAGALNLINKMEAKIAMRLKNEQQESAPIPANHQQTHFSNQQQSHTPESHQDRNQRRTRWEQPTRDDQEKLHELMEEAGIGNFYREATEQAEPTATTPVNPSTSQPSAAPQVLHPHVVSNPTLATLLSNLNIPNSIVAATQNPCNPFVPDAQFLQSLQLLSAAATSGPNGPSPQQIHQATQAISQQLQSFQQGQLVGSPGIINPFTSVSSSFGASPTAAPSGSAVASHSSEKQIASPPPASQSNLEHLPKMQREIFKRIQNMQSRKEQELSEKPEVPLDDDWYSSEEEEPERNSKSAAPFGKFRQSPLDEDRSVTSAASSAASVSLKDVDLRSMPFGDTDFRLPPLRSGESFQDVDLRPSDASGFKKPPAETPATEIEAGISSHAGIPWKVVEVAGVMKIDYSYLKGNPQSASLFGVDPRLASLRLSSSKVPIGPASPPPMQNAENVVPIGIPSASDFSDPRMRKSMRETGVRQSGIGPDSQQHHLSQPLTGNPQLLSPAELTPAAIAQLMQSAAVGTGNPSPFMPTGAPFLPPDFMNMAAAAAAAQAAAAAAFHQQQSATSNATRQPFHQPKSSWESRYQQGSGGVTPPL